MHLIMNHMLKLKYLLSLLFLCFWIATRRSFSYSNLQDRDLRFNPISILNQFIYLIEVYLCYYLFVWFSLLDMIDLCCTYAQSAVRGQNLSEN